jgi:L-fucose isomerase-like protein
MYESEIKGKFAYDYDIKDTFMGFHCGNTCSTKLAFHEMKNQKIIARTLPEEVTNGTLEGDLIPGHATVYRLQSTSDAGLRAYVAEGEILPVRTRSFGGIGIFAIPEMGRFYRHVLVEKNYPHHAAITFHHNGRLLYEVFNDVVCIVAVAQKVLAAQQHLQLCVLEACSQLSEPFPGIFLEETEAGIECGAAPALNGIVADLIQLGNDGKHHIGRHSGGNQRLMSITQNGIRNFNRSFHLI